jgi:2-polyprenyl-6-hydroxyphenyl methylase/3-demethylubiquinone-9 3-methyltransferase
MNVAPDQLAKFEDLGAMWRDPAGPMRVLHVMNPLRTQWVVDLAKIHHPAGTIAGLQVLDVGCGAGLFSESLARRGAQVTGIDPVARNVHLAEAAAARHGDNITYRTATPDILVREGQGFDIVCALEVIEHVPDRTEFLQTLGALVRPGGLLVITTIDRTVLSWLAAIVMGEYVLHVVPKGSHRWDWFMRPREVGDILALGGMTQIDLRGMRYLPVVYRVGWTKKVWVNWAGAWRKGGSGRGALPTAPVPAGDP